MWDGKKSEVATKPYNSSTSDTRGDRTVVPVVSKLSGLVA